MTAPQWDEPQEPQEPRQPQRPRGAGEPVGSLASEATQLVEAVQAWVKGAVFARLTGASRPESASSDQWAQATAEQPQATAADGSPECPECREHSVCSVCPICRSIRLVQAAQPEVVEHLADAVTSISAAIRELGAEDRRLREEGQWR